MLRGTSFTSSCATLVLLAATWQPSYASVHSVCSTCEYHSINAAITGIPLGPGVTILVSGGPYREKVAINNKDGQSTNREVVRASGTVVVDGSDPYNSTSLWTQVGTDSTYFAHDTSGVTPPDWLLIVDDVQYQYVPDTSWANLHTGQWGYNAGNSRIYINAGSTANPGTKAIYVGARTMGFNVDNSDYLTIAGFTVTRASGKGIDVRGTNGGTRTLGVIVDSCSVTQSFSQGIFLRDASNCIVRNSSSSYNGSYGILLDYSDNCQIVNNRTFSNDAPFASWGGVAGIKLGSATTDSTEVKDITIDYNVSYGNEDSGIDLKAARRVLVRRNVCYANGDHGFDNNHTDSTTFINNLAFRNNHDGLSVENTSRWVNVFNNMFVHNGIDGTQLASDGPVCEMQILGDSAFVSDYNVVVPLSRLKRGDVSNHWWRSVVERHTTEFVTFQGYRDSTASLDEHSYTTLPAFADTTSPDFTLTSSSDNAVDAAKTNMTGWLTPMWLSVDPRGYVTHDYAGTSNDGAGSPDYGDIGAYEFDSTPGAPTIDFISWGRWDFSVNWVNSGDDGAVGTAGTAEVLANNVVVASAPVYPTESEQCIPVGAAPCTGFSVKLRITEADNGKTVESNTVSGSTLCSGSTTSDCTYSQLQPPPESSAKHMKVGTDYALALDQPSPNPTVSGGLIGYSIPRALSGQQIDLSMFDIGGRRASQLVSGPAKAGRFTVSISGDGAGQRKLRPGVYYARLRIAGEVFTRTIVLTH